MKKILFSLFCLCLTFMSCSHTKKSQSTVLKQGIEGLLVEETGNRMPMVGATPKAPKPMKGATVLVYEPTKLSQVNQVDHSPEYTAIHTKLVASITTDSTGVFKISLPQGSYSIFVKQKDHYYANLFDGENNINMHKVEEGKVTKVKITVSSGAVY